MKKPQELIKIYNTGTISEEDYNHLEYYIEHGEIDIAELNDVSKIQQLLPSVEEGAVSDAGNEQFYSFLNKEKNRLKSHGISQWNLIDWWHDVWRSSYQPVYTIMLLLIGLLGGYFWSSSVSSSSEVELLTAEVQQMKELMLLTMIENTSTTERLKAVSLTSDMKVVSDNVSLTLISVLRSDENTNVRLAAITALTQFINNPKVREELILSIKYQESPLVQLALAELMVVLKEEKSVKEFEVIIKSKSTPDDVKKELQNVMQVLI